MFTVRTDAGTYGIVYSTGSTMPAKDSVTLNGVTANGSPGSATTLLTLTFNEAVTGLSAGDITLTMPNPFGVTKKTLSGNGPTYTLGVDSPVDGTLSVAVGSALLHVNGSPKEVNIYGDGSITVKPLVENQWADGNLPLASSVDWYSFSVTAGKTYRIWWNDSWDGPSPANKTGDVKVSAWYANGNNIFGGTGRGEDAGWDTPQGIDVTANGTVYVRVMPYNDSFDTGTYGVVYSTVNSRPVIPNPGDTPVTLSSVTPNGSAGNATTTLTLTFSAAITGLSAADITLSMNGPFGVTKGAFSGSGPSYTLGVSSPTDGTLTVTVGKTGYNIIGSPKEVNIYGNNSITVKPLVVNQWADGTLPSASSVDWYSFTVTAGTTYRIWWNDSYARPTPKTKTGDVEVSALYANGTYIFEEVDGSWFTPQTINVTANGTVYVKVTPLSAGTYGIVYSTGTTRPE
jgi:hypothetical protein